MSPWEIENFAYKYKNNGDPIIFRSIKADSVYKILGIKTPFYDWFDEIIKKT